MADPGKTAIRGGLGGGTRLEDSQFLIAAAVLLLAVGYVTVSGSLNEPWFELDSGIYNSHRLAPDTPWADILKPGADRYMPVTWLSYRLNAVVFGHNAYWSFRLFNAVLHALSGLALVWMLMGLGMRRLEALVIGLAWTAHPMACENAAWLAKREYVLAFFFGVVSMAVYVRYQWDWPGLFATGIGLTLACLSSPMGLAWIPLFLAFEALGGTDRFCGSTHRSDVTNAAGMGIRLIPLVAVLILFGWMSMQAAGGIERLPPPGGSALTAILGWPEIAARTAARTLLPLGVSIVYYVEDAVGLGHGSTYLYFLIMVAAFIFSFGLARSRLRVAFGWIWFYGALLVGHHNLVAGEKVMSDSLAYFAYGGVLLVLVEFVLGLCGRLGGEKASLDRGGKGPPAEWLLPLLGLGILYVAFLGFMAAKRSFEWRAQVAVFERAVESQPHSALARFYLARSLRRAATVLEQQGDAEQTNKEYDKIEKLIAEGFEQSDAYRFRDQLGIRILWTEAAMRLGKYGQVREMLKGFTPPPEYLDGHARKEELKKDGILMFRLGEYGTPYYCRIGDLARAYRILGEADLDAFLDPATPPDAARAHLARAKEEADRAVRLKYFLPEAHYLKAGAILAERTLEEVPPGTSEEDAIKRAREALAAARPFLLLRKFYLTNRTKVDLHDPPEVSPDRLRAIGCLALGADKLNRSLNTELSKEEAVALAKAAIPFAESALKSDPTASDAHFLLGSVYVRLYGLYKHKFQDETEAESYHGLARGELRKVEAGTPRADEAQDLLEELGIPREAPPVQEGEEPEGEAEPDREAEPEAEAKKKTEAPKKDAEPPAETEPALEGEPKQDE